jgi:gamma-glutamyltranspeptidase
MSLITVFRYTVEGLVHGAVATDDGRCSDIGNSILRDLGGNAVDAAVAVTLCLGIVNPSGSTPGGGGVRTLCYIEMNRFACHSVSTFATYVCTQFALVHAKARSDRGGVEFIDERKHTQDVLPGEKATEVIDCREVAPAAAGMSMFDGKPEDASFTGGLAIGVPAQLHCLSVMHSRYGSIPWSKVVEPAVKMAREGAEITPYLAHAINLSSSEKKIFHDDALKTLLTKDHDGKTLLQDGDIYTNPALADLLEDIMDQGIDAFYKGKHAEHMAAEIQAAGGIITAEDFANVRATIRDALITEPGEIKGFTMVGVPPPSSGGCVVIGAARFMAGYPEALSMFDDTLSEHRAVEAMKHLYAMRMSLSDPAYFTNVTDAAVRDMMEGPFMEKLRDSTLDDDVLSMSGYGGSKWGYLTDSDVDTSKLVMTEEGHDNRRRLRAQQSHRKLKGWQYLEDHGTTHFSIVDKDGNAVTMTTTINTYFGSGVASPSTGVIFNSQVCLSAVFLCLFSWQDTHLTPRCRTQMDDFSSPGVPNHYGVEPSESNYITPGKKPLSSVAPTLIFRPREGVEIKDKRNLADQQLIMIVGASGGPKIPTATFQTVLNYIFRGLSLYDAVARPRLHDQLLYKGHSTTLYDDDHLLQGPNILSSQRTRDALIARGHEIAHVTNTGCVQAVALDLETGLWSAVSDPRKGGRPAGY